MKTKIEEILAGIKHPEHGSIVESGIVNDILISEEGVTVILQFNKKRDPFANSIKKQIENIISKSFPQFNGKITIELKEVESPNKAESKTTTGKIKKVIAIASGKGGVGKSTMTANLASVLNSMGFKVGILDADIYGPSQPKMFGVEEHTPQAVVHGDENEPNILPAESNGIKISSIGFFIPQGHALVWRGPMATSALKQLTHQTEWGELDYLLIDLPPGTGDVHLSIISEIKIDGAVIVSTPQQMAIADVERGISMFRAKGVDVPVLGIVENMAWFTPAELPENRYYIFGKGGARELAQKTGVDFLGDIPIIQSIMDGGEKGIPASALSKDIKKFYVDIIEKIVHNIEEQG